MTTALTEFLFLLLGAIALDLVTFPVRDTGAALRHALARPLSGDARRRAALFWEATARNLVLIAALLAAVGFVTTLSRDEPFPPIAQRMGEQIFGPLAVGLALAVLCALAASRGPGAGPREDQAPASSGSLDAAPSHGWLRVEAGIGYALLAALLALVILKPGDRPGFRPVDWLLHAPAWLTVGAGAVAAVLYRGRIGEGGSLTVGLGSAGSVSALLGLLHALHGFAGSSIEAVAGGLVFSFSACVATLVGLVAVGLPREDRALAAAPAAPSRLVWYGFPGLTLVVVSVAWLLVSTPMQTP